MKKAINPNHGWQTHKHRKTSLARKALHSGCNNCIHWEICSKQGIKNVKPDTNYCQWPRPGHFVDRNLRLINDFAEILKQEQTSDPDPLL